MAQQYLDAIRAEWDPWMANTVKQCTPKGSKGSAKVLLWGHKEESKRTADEQALVKEIMGGAVDDPWVSYPRKSFVMGSDECVELEIFLELAKKEPTSCFFKDITISGQKFKTIPCQRGAYYDKLIIGGGNGCCFVCYEEPEYATLWLVVAEGVSSPEPQLVSDFLRAMQQIAGGELPEEK